MRGFAFLVLAAAGSCLTAAIPTAEAQVLAAPECPYGYYDAAPYNCAPSGYYGPEWFTGNAFVGAGPWFHGSNSFRGNVNNALHPDNGYKGPMPARGEKAVASKRVDAAHFTGNEERDGRGNATGGRH